MCVSARHCSQPSQARGARDASGCRWTFAGTGPPSAEPVSEFIAGCASSTAGEPGHHRPRSGHIHVNSPRILAPSQGSTCRTRAGLRRPRQTPPTLGTGLPRAGRLRSKSHTTCGRAIGRQHRPTSRDCSAPGAISAMRGPAAAETVEVWQLLESGPTFAMRGPSSVDIAGFGRFRAK